MGQDELDITVEQDVLGMEIWDKLFDVGEEEELWRRVADAAAANWAIMLELHESENGKFTSG